MRLFNISVLSLAAISIASAGQIEIGASNGTGVTTSGLTVAYIGSGSGPSWAEKGVYQNTLFAGATSITGGSLNGVAETSAVGTGNGGSMPNYESGFQQFTDTNNGATPTFGMLDDGANSMNLWASGNASTTGSTSIVVPVEVSGVSSAYILLNDYFGVSGSDYQVVFNYSGGSTDTFNLTAGTNIDDAVHCGSTASPTWTGAGNCTTYLQSTSAGTTDNAWTANYGNTSNNTTVYSGTSGNLALSDLTFNVSAFSGLVLQSITITEEDNLNDSSKLGLSAITVAGSSASIVTPEPSTVLLFLAGLGVMAFFGQRRKAHQ